MIYSEKYLWNGGLFPEQVERTRPLQFPGILSLEAGSY